MRPKLKTPKRRSTFAVALAHRQYRQRVVQNKVRKELSEARARDELENEGVDND